MADGARGEREEVTSGDGGLRRRRLRRLRAALLGLIALLYVASIPWYRTPGEAPSLVFGLPDWVAVALGCYAMVAVLNAVAWLITEVPDREPKGGGGDPER